MNGKIDDNEGLLKFFSLSFVDNQHLRNGNIMRIFLIEYAMEYYTREDYNTNCVVLNYKELKKLFKSDYMVENGIKKMND